MFDAIAKLFAAPKTSQTEPLDAKMATAALLVHLAAVDGIVRPSERDAIAGVLQDHFELNEDDVTKLVDAATRHDKDAVDFYKFTSTLSKLEEEERINIIRHMWQVVYADAHNHELEDNMVWRVAELIGVSARQRTVLRQQMKRNPHE